MTPDASLSVVALIPAWNEAARIAPVVRRAVEFLPVLVVDDGSSDRTAGVAAEAGAIVVRHERNQGKGAALRTGFAWSGQRGATGVLTLDADGQHDPGEIPRFLEAWSAAGADLVIGRRDFRRMPFPRNLTNPFGSWLLSLAVGQAIPDNQSGFRLYGRRMLDLAGEGATGFEFELELILQAVFHRLRIHWVAIRTIYDTGKASYFRPIQDSLIFLATVARAYRLRRSLGRP